MSLPSTIRSGHDETLCCYEVLKCKHLLRLHRPPPSQTWFAICAVAATQTGQVIALPGQHRCFRCTTLHAPYVTTPSCAPARRSPKKGDRRICYHLLPGRRCLSIAHRASHRLVRQRPTRCASCRAFAGSFRRCYVCTRYPRHRPRVSQTVHPHCWGGTVLQDDVASF